MTLIIILLLMSLCSGNLNAALITKQPYTQNAEMTAMTIHWETDFQSTGTVYYGLSPAYGYEQTDNTNGYQHEVTLTGLLTSTLYHFKVKSGSIESTDKTFHTAVDIDKPFRFVVYGDSRTQKEEHRAVVNEMLAYKPDIYVHTGDLVETGISNTAWDEFFEVSAPLLDISTLYPVFGNHELGGGDIWDKYFAPPTDLSGSEKYYAFLYGSCFFITLNVMEPYWIGSSQYKWFEKTLAEASSSPYVRNIFAIFHYPAYSASKHGGDFFIQNHIVPLLEDYGVTLVFTGHDHDYERANVNGITYFVSGGGGAPLYSSGHEWWTVYSASVYHFIVVDIIGDYLHIRAIDINGTVFDDFRIGKPIHVISEPVQKR